MFRFYVAATLDRDLAFGIGIWHLWGYRKRFARLPITEPRVSSIARVRVSLAGAAAEKADCHAGRSATWGRRSARTKYDD